MNYEVFVVCRDRNIAAERLGMLQKPRDRESTDLAVLTVDLQQAMSQSYTAKIEGLLLLLCGYLSFIVGNLQVIMQLYRLSTINSLCRQVFYMTASQSCMLLIIVMIQSMKLK